MCQALVNPDCSKPKVTKSMGMTTALIDMLTGFTGKRSDNLSLLENKGLLFTGLTTLPTSVVKKVALVTVEFAGVKFKSNAVSGLQYLKHVENGVIKNIFQNFPQIERMVICEEKYLFTPDDFKAATQNQRMKSKSGIAHLKSQKEMLGAEKFYKESLIRTAEGKSVISKYLAANISQLHLRKDIVIDVDSELNVTGCYCGTSENCNCIIYSTPISALFSSKEGHIRTENLTSIKQTKGEAEMSQFDWLFHYSTLQDDCDFASVLSSGDIDGLVIHLFGVSRLWPPNGDGTFRNSVFVVLQKPGEKMDIFNITGILTLLEEKYSDRNIGMKVALNLCIGGNDFIPKLHNISHVKIMKIIMTQSDFLQELYTFDECGHIEINPDSYLKLIKYLYCSKKLDPDNLTYEEVRKSTMTKHKKLKGSRLCEEDGNIGTQCSKLQQWMPLTTAMENVAKLLNLQLQYLVTAGIHCPIARFYPQWLLEKDLNWGSRIRPWTRCICKRSNGNCPGFPIYRLHQ